jgi:hypothetical protein
MKPINIIIIVVAVLLLLGTFIGGVQYGKSRVKCPTITVDTLILHDTITYHIKDTIPYYIAIRDTVYQTGYITTPVDTAEILKDYFSVHVYDRQWADTLIEVSLTDKISKNTPIDNEFSYKILRPQTIVNNSIDNSVTYNRYISLGLDVPIKNINYLELEAIYHTERWYTGLGYEPEINSFNVKLGMTLIKFKHRK